MRERKCLCGCGKNAGPRGKGFAPGHKLPRAGAWFRVDKRTGCHIWLGATWPNGRYGVKRDSKTGRNRSAHIVYWEAAHGPVPPDSELNHKCKRGLCVNVEHMEIVRHQVNVQLGNRAKLSLKAVEEIRRLYKPRNKVVMALLTSTFNISRYTVWSVATKRTWDNIAS